jgi:hypothetical protein
MPQVDALRMDQVFAEDRDVRRSDGDVLFKRARVLAPQDRLLIELAYQRNLTVRQIGQLLDRPAGSVSRRIKNVCQRLRHPLVAALLEPGCPLDERLRQIGIEYFAQKREIRELARDRQMTATQVRAVLNFVRGWCRGVVKN